MKTLIIIRPYAILRGLLGEILMRFEKHGIRVSGMKIMQLPKETAEKLYEQHNGKEYFNKLVEDMTSSPSAIAVLDTDVLDTESAIALVRKIIGDKDPGKADMGTVRGDFGLRIDQNIIHASDSKEAAEREIPLFFKKEELCRYKI
ncbi:MAG: nucleoside-diphosphate kinase [Candidatus Altiarchaeota archaeon]|nr:nucleoside-diphosphate kinase [Candidatus Altiarchaeota archaeon]